MRLLVAFIITVLVYSLLIWLYLSNFREIKLDKKRYTESVVKIDILDIPPPKQKKVVKKESKKIVKNKKIKNNKVKNNKKVKKTKKIVKKKKRVKKTHITKKNVVKKNIKKKNVVSKKKFISESEMLYIPNPIIKEKTEVQNSALEGNVESKSDISYPNSKVKKLYGKEFHTYTPTQKEFIEKNLDEIHRITQETLWNRGYPGGIISARTGQEGINIVSFYLHPNGDISNLRLKQKVGYRVLDNNTIETIKSAYKDYPYPKEKTKMIFFVEYSIFGY